MAREFFRIVAGNVPTLKDFWTMRQQGRPLRNPALRRDWAEGISVYDDLDAACEVARKYGFRPGAYVVKVMVPDDGSVAFRQIFDEEHHYTIYDEPERVFAFIEGDVIPIPGATGE